MAKGITDIIKFLFVGLFFLSFLILVGGALFTWKNPAVVRDMLTYIIPSPTPSPLQIKGIAVLGDSQSDEYRADDNRGGSFSSTTINWVEILQKGRNVNFGKWGEYEEPRRMGYEYNWARTGATANSVLESGQHVGIAQQVKDGRVNVVIVYIGANDFAPYITEDGYRAIYDGSLNEAAVIRKVNRVVADITTAVDVILASGKPHIVLVKIPDWGEHIGVQAAFPFPDQRNRVTRAVDLANKNLQQMADDRSIPTIDPNLLYTNLVNSQLRVGNTNLQMFLLTNDPKNVFLDDGIHPGTVLNGLFANSIIKTLNEKKETNIRTFTDKEILNFAGIYEKEK